MEDSMKAERIILPDGSNMTFSKCLDNIKNTRDIYLYLDLLIALQKYYMIILSVKDTPGECMPDDVLYKVHKMGFDGLTNITHKLYIGISDRGCIVFNKCGNKPYEKVEFVDIVCDVELLVTSKPWGNVAEIRLAGTDYSMNCRGLNFVVYDYEKKEVVDSAVYDSHVPTPTFYHKNFYYDESYFDTHFYVPKKYRDSWSIPYQKKYYTNRTLCVREIENGIIEPLKTINGRDCGGVCDEEYNFITGHINYAHDACIRNARHICRCYKAGVQELKYSDEAVVFGGIIHDHPGHLIAESFAERMWWVLKNREINLRIAIVVAQGGEWGDGSGRFFKEFLEIINFPVERILIVKEPTKFCKVIVPDQSEMMNVSTTPYELTTEYASFFEYMRNAVKPSRYKKIYLTKDKTKKGNIVGEEYFIEFYRSRGFKIICPEDYTIREKAEFMLGAEEVVSPVGTNTLYSIFCKPTTRLTILTRINSGPFYPQSIVAEAAGIKEIYMVNTSICFLHENFFVGLSLMGVTDDFKKYVKDIYGEDLEITAEESLKSNLYSYLKFFPEYYSEPRYYNSIKNQKMLTVLQKMSEIFLNKEFDTSRLDLSTTESSLSDKLNLSIKTLDFLKMLLHDILTENRLLHFLLDVNCNVVSMLCDDSYVAEIIQEILQLLNIKLLCSSSKTKCGDVPENEWKLCRESDIVLGYSVSNSPMGVRDDVKVINIGEVISGQISVKALNEPLEISGNLYFVKTLAAANNVKERLGKQVSSIAEQMACIQKFLQNENKLQSEIKVLYSINEDLREEKYNLEKSFLVLKQEYEITIKNLKQEQMCIDYESKQRIKELDWEVLRIKQEYEFRRKEHEQKLLQEKREFEIRLKETADERRLVKNRLEQLQIDNEKIMSYNMVLKQQIEQFENSQSWRVTKPLRSLKWFFLRISGKTQ